MKFFTITALLLASPLAAQSAPQTVPGESPAFQCPDDGTMIVSRVSKLKPTGTRAGYEAAVQAHRAWYARAGLRDVIDSAPIISRDGKVSETEFASVHLFERRDARATIDMWPEAGKMWDAYVKLYRDNSEIVSETRACLSRTASLAVK